MLSQKVLCCVFQRPSSTVCSNSVWGFLAVFLTPLRNNTRSSFPNDIQVHKFSFLKYFTSELPDFWIWKFEFDWFEFWWTFRFIYQEHEKLHFQPSFSLEIYPAHNYTNVILRTDSIRSIWIILLLPSKVRYWKPHWNNVTFTSKQSNFN